MVRVRFQQELQNLQLEMLKMGSMVEKALAGAVHSLKSQDLAKAQTVLKKDDEIDALEARLEEACFQLIMLQQPVAGDLRTIGATLKTLTDLERLGDYANNIAEVTLRIGSRPLIKPLVDIPKMADMALAMVRQALDAFVARDVDAARDVCHADDEIDQVYSHLFDELEALVSSGIESERVNQAIHLLFVARYLERVGDHATNIAERVIYMVTGERVPHQLKEASN